MSIGLRDPIVIPALRPRKRQWRDIFTRWLQRQPETLRLVARIPLEKSTTLWSARKDAPMFYGESGGLYVRMEDPSRHPQGLTTFICIGWDVQPRWRIATYYDDSFVREVIGPEESYLRSTIQSLSPDGRVFALAEADRKAIRVTSWRNGRLRGQVMLPWPDVPAGFYRHLQATNSGRIWIYDSALWATSSCRFWVIDQDRVISGEYTTSFATGGVLTKCELSPGGTGLLCYQIAGAHVDYVTLIIHGEQVRTARRYTLPKGGESYHWLNEELALGSSHTLIGPAGVVKRAPWETLRLSPSHEPGWAFSTNREIDVLGASADVRTVLVRERDLLSLYTAPGRLRAVLPLDMLDPLDCALSPDGRRVAILLRHGAEYEINLYAWGKK